MAGLAFIHRTGANFLMVGRYFERMRQREGCCLCVNGQGEDTLISVTHDSAQLDSKRHGGYPADKPLEDQEAAVQIFLYVKP